jgi:hypothetical protein
MKESTVESRIIAYAKSKGVTAQKQNGMHNRGKADQLLMRNGVAAFLEIKRPGQKPTALQLRYIKQRSADGFAADWVDTFEKGKEFIDRVFP